MDRFEDIMAIRDLPSRYATYVDTFQTDRIMELWTDDARFDETRVGTGLHEGKAALRRFFDGL